MAKHKLYRQFENTTPLPLNLNEEISHEIDLHPSTPDTKAHVRGSVGKSKCAHESLTNKKEVIDKEINLSSSESSIDGDCVSWQEGDCVSWQEGDCVSLQDGISDPDDFFFNCSSGIKLPYSAKEDEWILQFVLKGQNLNKVGSLSLWKHLESKKENPKRTYQSLKNRFLRNIRPHIFTRYRHLISSNKEVKKILAKFPELRCKVGSTNTLSRIQLPARNLISKFAEDESVNNYERVPSPRTSTTDSPPKDSARQELILNMNFSNFERKVTIGDNSVEVWVNFNSKQQLRKPVTPPIGIYKRYENIKKKNKLVLCPACGRYNKPKLADSKGDGESVNFNAERRVLTANSSGADPGNSSVTSLRSPPAKCRKVGESGLSPSLLRDATEEHTQERPLNTGEVGRAPEAPGSVALRQGPDSAATDRLMEAHDDLDSTYDDVVADFKKLIKNEEERLLVRRCLLGKDEILGLSESISQMSTDSFFVDLSANLETPALTADYSTPNRQSKSVGEGGNSRGLLARNMMKMLNNKTPEKS